MKLPRSLVAFSAAGLCATGLHIVVAAALMQWALWQPAAANGVAFCVANAFSFVANSRWSFGTPMSWHSLRRFIAVSALGCGFTVLIATLGQVMALQRWASLALVVLLVPPASYLAHRFYTFIEPS